MKYKVSIIMPCYEEPESIFRGSIESVIKQTLQDVQIIVVLDNPDNHGLRNVILEYQNKHNNILLLVPQKNLWRWWARNLGILHSTWSYIAIHDADDIDMPERLEEQYTFMEDNPDVWVVFSKLQHIDSQWNRTHSEWKQDNLSKRNKVGFFHRWINHPSMFIRSEILKHFMYNDLKYLEDLDLWMRLFTENIEFWFMNEVHTQYNVPHKKWDKEYTDKMKKWKIYAIKLLIKYSKNFYKDPEYYAALLFHLFWYFTLQLGGSTYIKFRTFISNKVEKSN